MLASIVIPLLLAAAPSDRDCGDDAFTDADGLLLRAARVKDDAGRRVHFFRGEGACPDGPAADCRLKPYLVPGDDVVVSKHRAGFACVWYEPVGKRPFFGWLPTAALEEEEPPSNPPASAWVRSWSRFVGPGDESEIAITLAADGRSLNVNGSVLGTLRQGQPPTVGEVKGTAVPEGRALLVTGDDCAVELVLLTEHTLFAREKTACGGVGASFTGRY
jgi:hypothetical protein